MGNQGKFQEEEELKAMSGSCCFTALRHFPLQEAAPEAG